MVGPCPGCGQPLTAEEGADAPTAAYALEASGVRLTEAGTIEGPDGVVSLDSARELVWAATEPAPWYREVRVGRSLFQAGVLLGLAGPLGAFLLAVLALSVFMHPAAEEWAKVGAAVWEALR